MPQILPFTGWRYNPGKADYATVTLPPAGCLSPEDVLALYKKNDRNAVRLLHGREFPTDTGYDNRYTRAAAHLDAWRAEEIFLQDKPAVYVCQQDFPGAGGVRSRRGFFARVRLGDTPAAGIFPHAKSLAAPRLDCLRQLRALRAGLEPVCALLTDPSGDISRSLYGMCAYAPAADFSAADGVRQRLWVLDDPEQAPAFCEGCSRESLILAAGHERYEAALIYRDEVREALKQAGKNPPEIGGLAEDYIMMYIVPDGDPGVELRPLHRLVRGVKDFDKFSARLEASFTVEKAADLPDLLDKTHASATPAFGFVAPAGLFAIRLREREILSRRAAGAAPEWLAADVSALHLLVLEDILGITPEREQAGENLRYTADPAAAIDAVRQGRDQVQCAFLSRPAPLAQVRACARAGALLPGESFQLHPAVPSGLVFNFFW